MTGRHREEEKPTSGDGPTTGRWRRVALVAGGVTVPLVLLGLVGIGLREKPEDEPAPAGITAEEPATVAPERNPVRGEYVPPRPPPAGSPAPRRVQPPPAKATPPVRKPPRRVERGRSCRWGDIPFLRKWCRRRGYSTP